MKAPAVEVVDVDLIRSEQIQLPKQRRVVGDVDLGVRQESLLATPLGFFAILIRGG
jgi:hypothetical protein